MQKRPASEKLRSKREQERLDDRLCTALITQNAQEIAYALEAGADANTKRLHHQFPSETRENFKQSPLHYIATFTPPQGQPFNPLLLAIMDLLWMSGATFSKSEYQHIQRLIEKGTGTNHQNVIDTYCKPIGMRYLHSLECGDVKPDATALEESFGIRFDPEKQRAQARRNPSPSSAVLSIGRELDKQESVEPAQENGCTVFMETMLPAAEREKHDWILKASLIREQQKRQAALN